MSFFSDLTEGNWGNLGHDLTAHFGEDAKWWGAAAGTALTAGLAGPELFGAAGLGEGIAEGVGAAALPEAAGSGVADAFAFAGPEAGTAAGSEGVGAINAATNLGTGFDPTLPQAFEGLGASSENLGAAADIAGGQGGQSGGFLNNAWEGAKSSLTKNPLGIAAAGAGLGMNILKGNPTDPNAAKLKQQADQLGAQGEMLRNYLSSGTLPPAMQQQLDQAKASAKARLVSNAAASGLPTDPNQNSALAASLNAVDMNAVAAMADAQLKMMQQGLSETGLSTQLYEMLVKMDRQNNTDLMNAIASFASALGGGGGGKAGGFKIVNA